MRLPRILIAQADPARRRNLAERATEAGFLVLEAADGEEALWMARAHLPEVAVVDLALGRPAGSEVIDRLKRHRATAGLPVVGLVGGARPATARAHVLGCAALELRAVPEEELLERVRRLLPGAARVLRPAV